MINKKVLNTCSYIFVLVVILSASLRGDSQCELMCPGGPNFSLDEMCSQVIFDLTIDVKGSQACQEFSSITQDPAPGVLVEGVGEIDIIFTATDISNNQFTCR